MMEESTYHRPVTVQPVGSTSLNKIAKLQNIEALLEHMIIHGFYKKQQKAPLKPALKIIK